mmetsp:Transcript_2503/g.5465  ORF Transcript_2503/g.5465 Transcript_2503/m.5465 type:complete len:265 (+) Transcript_2503:1031-1825(+)
MVGNASNFWHVLESIHQRRVVCLLALLASEERAALRARLGFPASNVHVIRGTEDVRAVHRESRAEHALHTLGMIHILGVPSVVIEQANGAVVRTRDEFATRRRVVNIHHRTHEILVHARCNVQLSHVIRIQVAIFISNGKIERFHGIPAQLCALILHEELFQRRLLTHVVQRDGTIRPTRRENVHLHRIITHRQHRVYTPIERMQRYLPRHVPHLHCRSGGGKLGLAPVRVAIAKPVILRANVMRYVHRNRRVWITHLTHSCAR